MSKLEQLIKEHCPNGVPYKTLGELGIFYGGLSGKSKEDFKGGNDKFITYMNVYSNPALKLDVTDTVRISEGEKQNIVQYGDVVFTGSSETPDECVISSVLTQHTSEKFYLNSFCMGYRLNDLSQFLPDFLKHLFRCSNLREQIKKTASGVTRFNVSKDKMKKVVISILLIAVMVVSAFALVACNTNKDPLVKIIDVQLTEEEYAFVMDKENTALQSDMNDFLQKIKDNGTFQTLVDKYFKGVGEKVGYTVTTTDVTNTAENFIVVTNCPFEPFEYLGTDGKIYGLDIEIAAAYAAEKNLNLVVKNIGVDDIFTQVDVGYADIGMAGITVSADREAVYNFSSTYYNASQKIIVAAGNTDFDNCTTVEEVEAVLASLQGKKVGYQLGTTGGMYVDGNEDWGYDGFANIEGKSYATALDAVNDLINGNIYAVVVDEAPANAIVTAVNPK